MAFTSGSLRWHQARPEGGHGLHASQTTAKAQSPEQSPRPGAVIWGMVRGVPAECSCHMQHPWPQHPASSTAEGCCCSREVSKVALGLVSRVIKGMNGLRETLCLLLWHSLSFSQAILHGSQELWAGSSIVPGGCFPAEAALGTRRSPRAARRRLGSARSSSPSSRTAGSLPPTPNSVTRAAPAPVPEPLISSLISLRV